MSNSEIKRLAIRGVLFNWIGRGCSFTIAFVLTPVILTGLGKESYGIWSIVMGLTGYYALAGLGLRSAATKFIAEAYAVGDRDRINRIVVTSVAIKLAMTLIVLLVVGGIAWCFPVVFPTGGESESTLRWVVAIVGLNFAVRLVGQPFAATLAALTRFDLANMLSVGSQVTRAGLVILVVQSGGGLLAMAWVTLAVGCTTQLVQYLLVSKVTGTIRLSPAFFDRGMVKELFSFGSILAINSALGRLSEYAGLLIAGTVLGPASAAFYSIAELLTRKTDRLSRGINNVVLPVASQLNATHRRAELIQMLVLVPRLLLTMSMVLTVVFVFMGRQLIDLWLGAGYSAEVYPVLCVLSLAILVSKGAGGLGQILKGMGRVRMLTWIRLTQFLLTVGLGFLFVHVFGLIGMAYAIFCAQVTVGLLVPWATCKELDYPLRRFLVKTILPAGAASLPSLLAAIVFVTFFPPVSIYSLLGELLCIALLAGLSAFFICLPVDVRREIAKSLRRSKPDMSGIPSDVSKFPPSLAAEQKTSSSPLRGSSEA